MEILMKIVRLVPKWVWVIDFIKVAFKWKIKRTKRDWKWSLG